MYFIHNLLKFKTIQTHINVQCLEQLVLRKVFISETYSSLCFYFIYVHFIKYIGKINH